MRINPGSYLARFIRKDVDIADLTRLLIESGFERIELPAAADARFPVTLPEQYTAFGKDLSENAFYLVKEKPKRQVRLLDPREQHDEEYMKHTNPIYFEFSGDFILFDETQPMETMRYYERLHRIATDLVRGSARTLRG